MTVSVLTAQIRGQESAHVPPDRRMDWRSRLGVAWPCSFGRYARRVRSGLFASFLFFAGISSAQHSPAESKATKPPLELPDVIVYGADTALREAGEKLSFPRISPSASPSEAITPYPSARALRGEPALPSRPESPPEQTTVLSSYAGLYSSWGAQAVHDRTLKKAHLRCKATLSGTDGQFDNSRGMWGGIEGRMDAPISSSAAGGLQAKYRRSSYGLYGSTNPSNTARQEKVSLQTHIELHQSRPTLSHLQLAFQRFTLLPEDTVPDYCERSENLLQTDFVFQDRSGPLPLSVEFHWAGNHPSGGGSADHLLTLGLKGKVLLLPESSFEAGGIVQWYSSKGNIRKRIFPGGRLVLRNMTLVHIPIAFHASIGGAYHYYSLAELLEMNPYAGPHIFTPLEEVRLQAEAGVEAELTPGFLLGAAYRWAQRRDDVYWDYDWESGLFRPEQLYEVVQRQIDFSLTYDSPSDPLRVEAGLSSLRHTVTERCFFKCEPLSEVPFRPKHRVWGTVSYEALEGFIVRSDWQWVGCRSASTQGECKLDPYLVINVGAEKRIRSAITLLANIYNLTDDDYETWDRIMDKLRR